MFVRIKTLDMKTVFSLASSPQLVAGIYLKIRERFLPTASRND